MRRWRRSAAIAALLVVALVGAPLARAVAPPACRSCPPQCPMHRNAKLGCHQATGSHHHCGTQGPGVGVPGCGSGPELPGIALPQGVLPAPVMAAVAVDDRFVPSCEPAPALHAAEPPDTPPPIARS